MSKFKVMKLSEITKDGACWSALRFTGECYNCDRVWTCKLRESRPGRIELLKARVLTIEAELKDAKEKLEHEKAADR